MTGINELAGYALRAIMIKHMGDLWAAQVTRRREADNSEVMEDLKLQWNDVRKFTPRMPTWAAVTRHTCSEFATSSSNGGARRLLWTPANRKSLRGRQPRPETRTAPAARRIG